MDQQQLRERLAAEFGGSEQAVRTVARQAGDLEDSGQLAADAGYEPTVERVLDHLSDAPDGVGLVERWNWWVGSLELAYGSPYHQFRVRADVA